MIILRETELRRDILEVAVALVAVEAVDAVARDEQVEFAVIVKVANRAADAAIFGQTSGAVHTERGSDVDEAPAVVKSEEHTSELQSLMRISYAVFCLKKKKRQITHYNNTIYTH